MAGEILHFVGKRKTAIARIWIKSGEGRITINMKPMDEFIFRESDRLLIRQPLELTDNVNKYDIAINVRGGGISGQAGAIRHGLSRALAEMDPECRFILKKASLLTRDPRVKERKKYGLRGARARFQYSKR